MLSHEKEISRFLQVEYVIAFAYSRHALAGILLAAGLKKGDQVILSPLTCKVVPLTLLSLNLIPVYADVSKDTLNLNPRNVQASIGPASRAILFQHTYGNPSGIDAIAKIAEQYKLLLVEDCAQCMPYAESDRIPGKYGQASFFSNNLRKPLPSGSGGVAVTTNREFANKILQYRNSLPHRGILKEFMLQVEVMIQKHILRPYTYWPFFELNRKLRFLHKRKPLENEIANEINAPAYQVSSFQVREGLHWLDKLEALINHRRFCCKEYGKELSSIKDLKMPCINSQNPLYYFPVLVENKNELLQKAKNRHIELISWPLGTPLYPVEEKSDLLHYSYYVGSCTVAENIAERLLGLPTDIYTKQKHRQAIISLIRQHFESL